MSYIVAVGARWTKSSIFIAIYAYPAHAVNVPFIFSHIKVSRSSLEPYLST